MLGKFSSVEIQASTDIDGAFEIKGIPTGTVKALATELLAQSDAPARERWLEAHRAQLSAGLGREVAVQARVLYLAWISTDENFPNIGALRAAQVVKRSARPFHHGTLTA